MIQLQKLRDRISSKVVDLNVERKRLKVLEDKLKSEYGITPEDVKKEYKSTKHKRRLLEDKLEETERILSKVMDNYGVV